MAWRDLEQSQKGALEILEACEQEKITADQSFYQGLTMVSKALKSRSANSGEITAMISAMSQVSFDVRKRLPNDHKLNPSQDYVKPDPVSTPRAPAQKRYGASAAVESVDAATERVYSAPAQQERSKVYSYPRCKKCNERVSPAEEAKCDDTVFHANCLRCQKCRRKLTADTAHLTADKRNVVCDDHFVAPKPTQTEKKSNTESQAKPEEDVPRTKSGRKKTSYKPPQRK
eukprot:4961_1